MILLLLVIFAVHFSVSANIPLWNPKGNPNPSLHYQRFRRDFYKSQPFYQWYYYWVRDLHTNDHYAFAYGMSACDSSENSCDYEGVYVMFSRISGNDSFVKYEFYDLSELEVLDKDSPHISIVGGKFSITPLDNDHFRVVGNFEEESKNVWYVHNCKENLQVQWNLTIERIYGWYGQEIFEKADEWIKGMIMWDTYAHTSRFVGSDNHIIIEGNKEVFDSTDRYRAYCDGNWGTHFPSGPKGDKDFCWGWYVVNEPNYNNNGDFSFAAGAGQSDSQTLLGVMVAKFADIRINSSYELSIRQAEIRKGDKLLDESFYSSTDGDLKKFDINRSQWVDYEDNLGKAQFPTFQQVLIETKLFEIQVNISSGKDRFNRLLFPFINDIFSDFEGLGVNADVHVFDKKWNKVVVDLKSSTAGVEYGYKFDTKKP